jgi:hypothetical protein
MHYRQLHRRHRHHRLHYLLRYHIQDRHRLRTLVLLFLNQVLNSVRFRLRRHLIRH